MLAEARTARCSGNIRPLGFLTTMDSAPSAPPRCPFPALEHLDIYVPQQGFFELLSALEDPAVLPALHSIDLTVDGQVSACPSDEVHDGNQQQSLMLAKHPPSPPPGLCCA